MTTAPERHPRAAFWGLDRWIGSNGSGTWERVQIVPADRTKADAGPLVRWFPIETYSEDAILAHCGPGRFRIYWRTRSRKHVGPSEPFELGIHVGPVTTPPAPPPSVDPPPRSPEPVSPPIQATPAPLALVPPGYVPKPPPGYMPPPVEHAFERHHHLAGEDADRVIQCVTAVAASSQNSVAQMAAAMIAVSGQRATEWQAVASQLLAHAMAPKPPDPSIAQIAQGQQALAAAVQALAAKVDDLEPDEDEPPTPPQPNHSPTGAEMFRAALPLIERVATPLIDRAMNAGAKPDTSPKADGSPGA